MSTLLLIAWRNVLAAGRRSLSLGAAIAFTALCLSLFLALSAGITQTMKTATTTLFSGDLNVNGFSKWQGGRWAPFMSGRSAVLKKVAEMMPEARLVTDRYMARGRLVSAATVLETPLWGVDYAGESPEFKALRPAPAAEFGASDLSKLSRRGTIALWAKQARMLELKVGDPVSLHMDTAKEIPNSMELRVVAVLKDWGMMSSFSLLIHRADMQALRQTGPDSTGQIAVYLPRGQNLPAAEQRLRQGLESEGYVLRAADHLPLYKKFRELGAENWAGMKLDVGNWKDECGYLDWMIFLINALFFGVTLALLLVIGVGVFNAMQLAVAERAQELGTLRAIGMGKPSVLGLVFLEGALLAALASGLGTALGAVLALILNALEIPLDSEALQTVLLSDHLVFTLRFSNLALSLGLVTVLTSVSALYPAWKASRLQPVKAMQSGLN